MHQEAYDKRKAELETVLEAFDAIIPKLKQTAADQKQDTVFSELSKIGKKNPIAALVAIATTMAQENKDVLIDKMNELKDNMFNSYQDNEQLH